MASKRRIRRKSCEGKVRYTTPEKALSAARVVGGKTREGYHPYRCDFGKHWHIAHTREHGNFVLFDKTPLRV